MDCPGKRVSYPPSMAHRPPGQGSAAQRSYQSRILCPGIPRLGQHHRHNERQYRHGRGEVGYEIPAGVCEPGETPEEAARRELLEETGFGGGTWRLNMVAAPNPSTSTNLCYSFIATGVRRLSDQHLEATEDIEVHLLYEDEVLRLMREGRIIQAPMLCSLWKYFAEKTSTTTV